LSLLPLLELDLSLLLLSLPWLNLYLSLLLSLPLLELDLSLLLGLALARLRLALLDLNLSLSVDRRLSERPRLRGRLCPALLALDRLSLLRLGLLLLLLFLLDPLLYFLRRTPLRALVLLGVCRHAGRHQGRRPQDDCRHHSLRNVRFHFTHSSLFDRPCSGSRRGPERGLAACHLNRIVRSRFVAP
jgi:hypothetical protein